MTNVEIGTLYRATGAVEEVRPANGKRFSLRELQAFVGGYIELVPCAAPIAYCNEEGRLHNLPLNRLASIEFGQSLVGDVIQVRREVA
jgi:hypothetical protein